MAYRQRRRAWRKIMYVARHARYIPSYIRHKRINRQYHKWNNRRTKAMWGRWQRRGRF